MNNTFEKELEALLNKYNKEKPSDTPDYVLAEYLVSCLDSYNRTVAARVDWTELDTIVKTL